MELPPSPEHQIFEEYLLMLVLFIKNIEKIYTQFSQEISNSTESKKLTLCYEKFFASYTKIHSACYQIFNDFTTLKETLFKQGEILTKIRPDVEACNQQELIKTLDVLSENGWTIAKPLLQKQSDYFFAIINPCIAANISSSSVQSFMQSLISASQLADEKYMDLTSNIIYLVQASETFYNFSLIFKNYIDKVSTTIMHKS